MSDKPKWWPENPCVKPIEIIAWEKASNQIWNAMQKNIGSDEFMIASILEAVDDALDGNEPSDFMMSFPIVRKAWEVKNERQSP